MDLLRAAAAHFSGIPDIPGSLKGAKQGETEDKLLNLHAQVGERLVKHAHDINSARGSAGDLVARVQADKDVTDIAALLMADLRIDEARSVALRVCAGCIEGAKVLRKDEMTLDASGKPTKREVSDSERQGGMEEVDRRCWHDCVYDAGVSIGPLDMRIRNKQEPIFDGIDQALLNKHFQEYFRRFHRPGGS
jgi:hypothetical protein